ncbi:hypothetical protein QNH22_21370 [Lysinibacillus pakistanensis]|uniref:DUF4829 domain-containing protein n=1 Tax=Lysinibacillus pakistanensis TaxID=759811 RepID=A0AAX3WSQ8_9BACI|nr:hypothetical protein [Lysinibacillus pakistanensis]MDM5230206.1 hypothetical protein [Lysinibacillus pakistanensis]WHY45795.1 hypothetical protein QNH22_21370 [Lysinibacillus pakistanensis]WHY50807.1 hypothetical protein QNH24_21335 [Lysinibacillus pakistanensis]
MELNKSKPFLLVLFSILICDLYYGTVNAKSNDTPPSFEEKITEGKPLTPLESQLMSFMTGLMVTEPKQAVELWISGVNNRSGAVQYAMLSPALRKQSKSKFEQTHWITGQSSPSVSNFRFTKVEKLSESKMQYTVKYDLWASYGDFGGGEKIILVEKNLEPFKEYWFISSITTKYNPWEAFTPAETVLK